MRTSNCLAEMVVLGLLFPEFSVSLRSSETHKERYVNIKPYGAKRAPIEWPCISGVHDKIFMKFGRLIACRDTKHLKNLNDINTTTNDLNL